MKSENKVQRAHAEPFNRETLAEMFARVMSVEGLNLGFCVLGKFGVRFRKLELAIAGVG